MNNLISVIVPIANSEEYLERCINSILNQTYENFEIICVLNGSSDNSLNICRKISDCDARVKIYSSEPGVSSARNYGLEISKGDWFAFVDSDDWIEPTYLEVLLKNAIENNAKVSACFFERDYEYTLNESNQNSLIILDDEKKCVCNFICSSNSMEGMVWNKLYQKDQFKDTKFDSSLKINEDCLYTFEIMKKCDRACISNAILYHWFQNKNGACHSKRDKIDFAPANVFLQIISEAQYLDKEAEVVLKRNYFCYVINLLFDIKKIRKNDEIEIAVKQCKKYKGTIWNRINYKMKIKYWFAVCLQKMH